MDHEEKYRIKLLFRKLSRGDENALTAIFDHFSSYMGLYLRRFEGMDAYLLEVVKAELLETLWDKRDRFAHEDNPVALMMGMAHKIALYRLREMQQPTVSIIAANYKESDLHADDQLLSKEYVEKLHKAIALLPPQEQRIFKLKYMDKLSHDEIASMLKLSKQTVKNTASRASLKIKKSLGLGLAFILLIIKIIKSL